jgi:hypothetical protein
MASISIRHTFKNNTLNISTRGGSEEKHSFNIVKTEEVIIKDVTHTLLTSDMNDTFYLVEGEFHNEGDEPAINCRRYDLNMTFKDNKGSCMQEDIIKNLDNLQLFWCKMWLKNNRLTRDNDKPALIWDNGDLMWYLNGFLKRNPFLNSSIYVASFDWGISFDSSESSDMIFHEGEELQRQKDAFLLNYSYDNTNYSEES